MSDGNILKVKEIFSLKQKNHKCHDIFLKGNIFSEVNDFFNYPIPSKVIGLYNVKNQYENIIEISINIVEVKCLLTIFCNKTQAITLLH